MPDELIKALVIVKKAIAKINEKTGMSSEFSKAIQLASDEVLENKIDMNNFPLVVY